MGKENAGKWDSTISSCIQNVSVCEDILANLIYISEKPLSYNFELV